MTRTMDDKELRERFQAGSLTRIEWCHRVHVRLAYLYLRESSYSAALDRVRRGILALNESFGARSSPDGGYHETLTCAWMQIVAHAMAEGGNEGDSEAFVEAHPELARKDAIYAYYSPELLATVGARTGFVEPDVKALPAVR